MQHCIIYRIALPCTRLQATVRQVLSLQLDSGQAAQACVTFTQLDCKGGTQAAQVCSGSCQALQLSCTILACVSQAVWQALLPVLKGAKPTFLTMQTSANHQAASAASRLLHAQLKVK